MVEEFRYQDKKVGKDEKDKGSLKNLVNEKFKKIDNKNGVERDDKEIYKAGQLVINQIINEIKSDNSIIRGEWALAPLLGSKETGEKGLIKELQEKINNLKGYNMLTNNADKINWVAQKIDNAENEVLKRLAKNRTTQDSRNLVAKSNETYKGKPMFVMEGGNDVKKQTGNIIFTEAANPVKIHEALKGLFNNPNIVYEIDYSGCDTSTPKGKAIKEKMTNLIGTQTCYLRYDSNQKTYTIRDKNGIGISDRAYIRQGVKLIPAGVRKWQSYAKDKKEKENLGKFDDSKLDELTNSMLKDMPSAKELEPEEQKALAEKTENRIIELLKKAKKLGYEIDPECITTKWIGNGHMELHLNSGTSEVSRTIRGNDGDYNKVLGEKLDKFVDNNEGEYKTYLTKRVKAKWQELDKLTKTETSNISKKGGKDGRENLDQKEREKKEQEAETHKQQVLYGIGLLEKMVDNYRETEGDSWLDSDDKNLVQIKQLIRNAKSSINESDVLDDDAIIKNFVDPIRDKWASVKNVDTKYKPQRDNIMKVFFGTKEEQISAIRSLGGRNRIFDNTETSFLAEEIEGNDNLSIENADIQKCLDNINNRTSMSIYDANGKINEKVKGRYDNTYESAKSGTNSLITLFVGRGWLPSNWEDEKDEVIKCMDRLRDQLISIDSQVNNISLSTESMIKENHEKRIKLEQKPNKTEEDMKILQGLTYLEENSDEAKDIYKDIIETTNMQLKYGNLGQVVRGGLLGALGKLGGGIKGKNADIYNDIKGLGGAFDFTDENAALTGEILTEIAITVAVAVVTGGSGLVAVGGLLRLGAMGARGAKLAKLAKNIEKLIKLQNKYKSARTWGQTWNVIKETSNAGRLALGTTIGSGLLLEGTTFNAASNMVHSAMNGTSLDTLNLNPVAKENIQTAAFLGALSIGNKIGGSVITKLHGATKIQAFSQAGLKDIVKNYKGIWTESVISEATAMFGAEQGLNFVLGHDIIDPETGEVVTSHLPTLPTQQELIQMIGMILAFKVAKPGLWAKYEQKLNDGTLQICRSTKKNEILIRDAKTGEIEKIQDLIDGKSDKDSGNSKKKKNKNTEKKSQESEGKSEEEIRKSEEELEDIKKRASELKAKIKEIEKQISEIENNKEISNRKTLAHNIYERRTGKKSSISINEHYEGKILDGGIQIIDTRTGKKTTVKFNAKERISSLGESTQELAKLDIEIAERMILGIKNGYIEVEDIAEAVKIKNGYPSKNLEIVGLENGNVGVRRKTNIRKLRQEKAELDNQLKGLESERRKIRTELNKEKKSNIEENTKKPEESETKKTEESETKKPEESETKKPEESETKKPEELETEEPKKGEIDKGKEGEGESETKKPEDIEKELDELLSNANKGNYEKIKLDWVTKAQFEAGVYIEGIHRRFKNLSLKPNTKLPKEFLRKVRESLKEFKAKCRNNLSENYKKLLDKFNKFCEKKLKEEGNEVEIKEEEINSMEEKIEKNEINDTDSPEVIAKKLEESLDNNTDFEVSKEAFTSGRFIEGIKNRFTKMIKIPNHSIPKDSIKRLRNKISEMMKKWGNNLSENGKKAIERFNRFLDNLLKQPGESVRINRQRPSDRPDRGINTERREMSEVERNSDVVAIGDLHGNYMALKGNMEYVGLARETNGHLEWTGGNKKVVFQGDILGDRGTDGLRIIQEIHQLREQARQQGGDIDIIVGNHDDFLISYLTGTTGSRYHNLKGGAIEISKLGDFQGLGLTELGKFIGKDIGNFYGLENHSSSIKILDIIRKAPREKIIKAMRNSPEGRIILEEICKMKVVSQVDDVLYCHTNPTPEMLEYLTNGNVQSNINTINQKYQGYLRKVLLGEGNSTSKKEFNQISDIFLDTANRNDKMLGVENYFNILKNSGINMISHGHNGGRGYRSIDVKGIKIVDTDYYYGHLGDTGGEHSVSIVKKEGGVNYIGDFAINATLEYPIGTDVYVRRTNGGETKAKVEWYNPNTKEYLVSFEEGGEIKSKRVTNEYLRGTEKRGYTIGQEVYVKRTNGGETRAKVEGYNPRTKEYLVSFEEGGLIKAKRVTDEYLRDINNKKTERPIGLQERQDINYFNGKSHQFEVTETQTRSNSEKMDKILSEINEKNKYTKLEELRKEITEQYKQATGEELRLTNEQLLSILNAHKQDGKLGELTLGQLKVKVKILSEAITDQKVRRFLLEAGFCGNKSGTEVLGNTEKTEFIQDFFNIDKIKSIEELKEKGDYLYFNGKNKRKEFKDAIFDGDFELAKKLYIEALNVTKDKLKKVGLTPEQNKFIVDCFRRRDYNGIKKILEEIKKTTKENTQVEDTEKKYSKIVEDKETGEKIREYDNIEKAMYRDPITKEEVLITRRELHERIIEKFLLDGEASKGNKQLIMSGGLPGAGKSIIEKSLEGPKVIVNPDLVKDYLPEYYDEQGRKFGAGTVHEESSHISKLIYDRAIKGGYSILYDSSMKDKPNANPPFPKYDKIVEKAYNQGYEIQARFIYDGGESRYRNAVIRERSMGLDNYNAYGTAYKTIEYLSKKDKRVSKTIIYDNSGNGKASSAKIIYENQQINMAESDQELINKFNDYQTFLDNLL